jgi:hypothetical protein
MATGGIFMSERQKKVVRLTCIVGIDEIIRHIKECEEKTIVFVTTWTVKTLRKTFNVKRIKHFADELGKELWVVSNDKLVLSLCQEHGIKVLTKRDFFSRMKQVKRQAVSLRDSGRYTVTVACILLLVLGIAYSVIPKATIVVSPSMSVVSDLIVLHTSIGAKSVDYDNLVIPAVIRGASFDADITILTTGSILVGEEVAQGKVTFINESESPVTVKAGTVLSSHAGVRFHTLEDVIVPAAKIEYLMGLAVNSQTGRADVPVKAVEKGSSGNVAKGDIRVIEGSPLSSLKVVNLEDTQGGSDKSIRVVSSKDTETARAKLDVEIQRRALLELGKGLTGDNILIDESLKLDFGEVLFDKSIGSEGTELTAVVEVYAEGTIVREDDLLKALNHAFVRNLPTNMVLAEDGLVIRDINAGMLDEHDAQLIVYTEGRVRATLDTRLITQMVTGLPVAEAVSTLSNMGSISQFEVLAGEEDAELPRYPFLIRVVVTDNNRR